MRLQEALEQFDYHKPGATQVERITTVRRAAKAFISTVWDSIPDGPDKTVFVRKTHEAMMTANKAIVLDPLAPLD